MSQSPAASASRPPHVLFGGSFDPVHEGHLAVARAARERLQATVHFLPAGDPAHRAPTEADALQRLAMLQVAIGRERGFAIDTRELSREGETRTIDTVEELRRELAPGTPLVLVIGMDSLRQFHTWKQPGDILAQAHLFACTRPGQGMPTARDLGDLAALLTTDASDLQRSPGGCVLIETTTAANMSATAIRAALAAGTTPAGLPAAVLDYIRHHRLYQADTTDRGALPVE